jgi:hypothetical protein
VWHHGLCNYFSKLWYVAYGSDFTAILLAHIIYLLVIGVLQQLADGAKMNRDSPVVFDKLLLGAAIALTSLAIVIATLGPKFLPGLDWIQHIRWVM